MRIICTICSKNKDASEEPLPAVKRYKGARIPLVAKIAQQKSLPLYFLSGKFGVIEATTKIPYYDQLLTPDLVEVVSKTAENQLRENRISEVIFYAKPKTTKAWGPYYETLEKACKGANVKLRIENLQP